ncbi:hypothetical protein Btru_048743, partial [Bulinus truncatus]
MASNIRVAVRIRPLNKKEKDNGARNIVSSSGNTVSITNINVEGQTEYGDSRERVKQFTFDFCYDGASEISQTCAVPCQEQIYQDMGTEILQDAIEGYNACMFAYGQTGTGKTYTMMGYPGELGITPRICEALFEHIDESPKENQRITVEISFLEIYKERVRDLLQRRRRKEPFTLKVREHPKHGPYVKDLSRHIVKDASEIQALIDLGNEQRMTASTYIHRHSSRSHAIVTITLTQSRIVDNLPSELVSKVHLVDLAGSERADPSYHSEYKGRIKEGAFINKSLVTLGNVISVLAQRSLINFSTESINTSPSVRGSIDSADYQFRIGSPSRLRNFYIPYRDSVLTWLLKDSLGGNSKTLMIATISPASLFYSDTISTLRYAQRAKTIVNMPKINEDENIRLIRELRAEIEILKKKLLEKEQEADPSRWTQEKLEEYQTRAAFLLKAFNLESDSSSPVASVGMSSFMYKSPCLVFFNAEPGNPEMFELKDGKTYFGQGDIHSEHFKELQGEDILQNHCHIENIDGEVTIYPENGALCLVNDQVITQPIKLNQGDHLQLGRKNTFQFREKQLYFKRSGSRSGSFLSVHSSCETISPSSSFSDLPSSVDHYPPLKMFNPNMDAAHICVAVERNYENEMERIEAAKRELEQLRRNLDAQKETLDEREEKILAENQKALEELQQDRRHLEAHEEAAKKEKEKQEKIIEEQRRKLDEDKLKFEMKLQQDLHRIKSLPNNCDTVMEDFTAQTDTLPTSRLGPGKHDHPAISGEAGQLIRQRKISVQGRYKEIAQKELLKKLSYNGTVRALTEKGRQADEKYKHEHRKLEAKKREIRMKEARMREQNAKEVEYIHQGNAVLDQMTAQREQLELYLEEKHDLQQVQMDSPRPIRAAWSVTDIASDANDHQGFPSRTTSLLHVSSEQQGMPAKSNVLSDTESDEDNTDSEEEEDNEELDMMDGSELESFVSDNDQGEDNGIEDESQADNGEKSTPGYLAISDDRGCASPSDNITPFHGLPHHCTPANRPSRGRSRVRRIRPDRTAKPESPSPSRSLTDTAAAVTARLYQPLKPRPDLEGNYLRSSRERISSPSVSPVMTHRSPTTSGFLLISQDEPKHKFLRKGSKKAMTSLVNDPLPKFGKRSRDSIQESVTKFDFLRKGSKKQFKADLDLDTLEFEDPEIDRHDYLRRKHEELQSPTRSNKSAEDDEMTRHDYLRRGDKLLEGSPHDKLRRQTDVESKARGGSPRSGVLSYPRDKPLRPDENLTHPDKVRRTRKHEPHEKYRSDMSDWTHKKSGQSKVRGINVDSVTHVRSTPSLNRTEDASGKKFSISPEARRPNPQSRGERRTPGIETLKRAHKPSGSQELTSSTDDIPKQKYLKKGSVKLSSLDQGSKSRPQFFKPVPMSAKKNDPTSPNQTSVEKPHAISRSQSYPSVKQDDANAKKDVKKKADGSFGGSDSKLHIIGQSPVRTRSKNRLVSSMTCLASVPELTSEEDTSDQPTPGTVAAADGSDMAALVAGVRRRSRQNNVDEWRRHSEPEGDRLADEFAKYTADIEGGFYRDWPEAYSEVRSAEDLRSHEDSSRSHHSNATDSKVDAHSVPEIQVSSYDSGSTLSDRDIYFLRAGHRELTFPRGYLSSDDTANTNLEQPGQSELISAHRLLNINVHGHYVTDLDSTLSPLSNDSLDRLYAHGQDVDTNDGRNLIFSHDEDESGDSDESLYSDSLEESDSSGGCNSNGPHATSDLEEDDDTQLDDSLKESYGSPLDDSHNCQEQGLTCAVSFTSADVTTDHQSHSISDSDTDSADQLATQRPNGNLFIQSQTLTDDDRLMDVPDLSRCEGEITPAQGSQPWSQGGAVTVGCQRKLNIVTSVPDTDICGSQSLFVQQESSNEQEGSVTSFTGGTLSTKAPDNGCQSKAFSGTEITSSGWTIKIPQENNSQTFAQHNSDESLQVDLSKYDDAHVPVDIGGKADHPHTKTDQPHSKTDQSHIILPDRPASSEPPFSLPSLEDEGKSMLLEDTGLDAPGEHGQCLQYDTQTSQECQTHPTSDRRHDLAKSETSPVPNEAVTMSQGNVSNLEMGPGAADQTDSDGHKLKENLVQKFNLLKETNVDFNQPADFKMEKSNLQHGDTEITSDQVKLDKGAESIKGQDGNMTICPDIVGHGEILLQSGSYDSSTTRPNRVSESEGHSLSHDDHSPPASSGGSLLDTDDLSRSNIDTDCQFLQDKGSSLQHDGSSLQHDGSSLQHDGVCAAVNQQSGTVQTQTFVADIKEGESPHDIPVSAGRHSDGTRFTADMIDVNYERLRLCQETAEKSDTGLLDKEMHHGVNNGGAFIDLTQSNDEDNQSKNLNSAHGVSSGALCSRGDASLEMVDSGINSGRESFLGSVPLLPPINVVSVSQSSADINDTHPHGVPQNVSLDTSLTLVGIIPHCDAPLGDPSDAPLGDPSLTQKDNVNIASHHDQNFEPTEAVTGITDVVPDLAVVADNFPDVTGATDIVTGVAPIIMDDLSNVNTEMVQDRTVVDPADRTKNNSVTWSERQTAGIETTENIITGDRIKVVPETKDTPGISSDRDQVIDGYPVTTNQGMLGSDSGGSNKPGQTIVTSSTKLQDGLASVPPLDSSLPQGTVWTENMSKYCVATGHSPIMHEGEHRTSLSDNSHSNGEHQQETSDQTSLNCEPELKHSPHMAFLENAAHRAARSAVHSPVGELQTTDIFGATYQDVDPQRNLELNSSAGNLINNQVRGTEKCLAVIAEPQQRLMRDNNTADIDELQQRLMGDNNMADIAEPQQRLMGDNNMADIDELQQRLMGDNNMTDIDELQQRLMRDNNTADIDELQQRLMGDNNMTDIDELQQRLMGDNNMADIAEPQQWLMGENNMTDIDELQQRLMGDNNMADIAEPHQRLMGDKNMADIAEPQQRLMGDNNMTDIAEPHQRLMGDNNMADIAEPHQRLMGDNNMADIAEPQQWLMGDNNIDVQEFKEEGCSVSGHTELETSSEDNGCLFSQDDKLTREVCVNFSTPVNPNITIAKKQPKLADYVRLDRIGHTTSSQGEELCESDNKAVEPDRRTVQRLVNPRPEFTQAVADNTVHGEQNMPLGHGDSLASLSLVPDRGDHQQLSVHLDQRQLSDSDGISVNITGHHDTAEQLTDQAECSVKRFAGRKDRFSASSNRKFVIVRPKMTAPSEQSRVIRESCSESDFSDGQVSDDSLERSKLTKSNLQSKSPSHDSSVMSHEESRPNMQQQQLCDSVQQQFEEYQEDKPDELSERQKSSLRQNMHGEQQQVLPGSYDSQESKEDLQKLPTQDEKLQGQQHQHHDLQEHKTQRLPNDLQLQQNIQQKLPHDSQQTLSCDLQLQQNNAILPLVYDSQKSLPDDLQTQQNYDNQQQRAHDSIQLLPDDLQTQQNYDIQQQRALDSQQLLSYDLQTQQNYDIQQLTHDSIQLLPDDLQLQQNYDNQQQNISMYHELQGYKTQPWSDNLQLHHPNCNNQQQLAYDLQQPNSKVCVQPQWSDLQNSFYICQQNTQNLPDDDLPQHSLDMLSQVTEDLQQNQSAVLHRNQSSDLQQNQSSDLHQNQSCDLQQNQSSDLHQNQSSDLQQKQSCDLHQNQSSDLHQNQSSDLHQNQSSDLHQNQSSDLQQRKSCDLQQYYQQLHLGLQQEQFQNMTNQQQNHSMTQKPESGHNHDQEELLALPHKELSDDDDGQYTDEKPTCSQSGTDTRTVSKPSGQEVDVPSA